MWPMPSGFKEHFTPYGFWSLRRHIALPLGHVSGPFRAHRLSSFTTFRYPSALGATWAAVDDPERPGRAVALSQRPPRKGCSVLFPHNIGRSCLPSGFNKNTVPFRMIQNVKHRQNFNGGKEKVCLVGKRRLLVMAASSAMFICLSCSWAGLWRLGAPWPETLEKQVSVQETPREPGGLELSSTPVLTFLSLKTGH